MKTTIVPAQITTVEDKIAGNLSLTQVLILTAPVFWAGLVYVIFIPAMTFALYKLIITIPVLIIAFILALRIEDKLVINWVTLLFRYNTRPKYFILNKNDTHLRALDIPAIEKRDAKSFKMAKSKRIVSSQRYGIKEQIAFEKDKENIIFKVNKKGGLNVLFNQIEK